MSMIETTHSLIKRASNRLGYSEKTIQELIKTDAEHVFEIKLKNGKNFKAYRVQHNNKRGPYKGGIRFHPEVDLDEARALATLMSLKTAVAGLPMGGGKGGVAVDPKQLSDAELEELSRAYVRGLARHIGPDKDVPAPDVNTDSKVIDWMVDEYSKISGDTTRASFTGKSVKKGGSLGREEATGRGGVIALRELLKHQGKSNQEMTYALQGFGNVGSFFALIAQAEQSQWKLAAVSDSSATVFAKSGLSAKKLNSFKQKGGRFADYNEAGVEIISGEGLVATDVDILVLGALGNAITAKNMEQVRSKYIVEMANGPLDEAADDFLTKKGLFILPDIVANAGGVIVSYLEWMQNKSGKSWSEAKVNAQLEKYVVKAVDEVYKTAISQKISLKEAAVIVALKRLNE